MEYKINDLVIGKVENVKPYVVFLSFPNGTRGLLHISEISDSFIKDIEKFLSEGDEVKVKVLNIDESNGFMRVSLKQVSQEERFSTHKNVKRKKVENSEEDFAPLLERLPSWIEHTLEKAKENKDED